MSRAAAAPPGLRLALRFWGEDIEAEVPTAADVDHFGFVFIDHRVGRRPGGGAARVRFETDGGDGFVAALTDPSVEKRVLVDRGRGLRLYERWHDRPARPTPLPPLFLPALAGLRVVHGAAANRRDGGGAVALLGASMAGKSTLLVGLGQRGWKVVCDDLLAVDTAGRALPYGRPVGVRETTLALFPGWAPLVRSAGRPMATASGTTWLVHPAAAALPVEREAAPIRLRVRVRRSERFSAEAVGPGRLDLGWRPDRHLAAALDAVEEALR
jgi:hypothetical protein